MILAVRWRTAKMEFFFYIQTITVETFCQLELSITSWIFARILRKIDLRTFIVVPKETSEKGNNENNILTVQLIK